MISGISCVIVIILSYKMTKWDWLAFSIYANSISGSSTLIQTTLIPPICIVSVSALTGHRIPPSMEDMTAVVAPQLAPNKTALNKVRKAVKGKSDFILYCIMEKARRRIRYQMMRIWVDRKIENGLVYENSAANGKEEQSQNWRRHLKFLFLGKSQLNSDVSEACQVGKTDFLILSSHYFNLSNQVGFHRSARLGHSFPWFDTWNDLTLDFLLSPLFKVEPIFRHCCKTLSFLIPLVQEMSGIRREKRTIFPSLHGL